VLVCVCVLVETTSSSTATATQAAAAWRIVRQEGKPKRMMMRTMIEGREYELENEFSKGAGVEKDGVGRGRGGGSAF